jgi:hypothetical protein
MFGPIPAYGFYVRHARGITFDNVDVSYDKPDERSAFILDDVKDVAFYSTKARLADDASMFDLRNVTNFRAFQIAGMADVRFDRVERRRIR